MRRLCFTFALFAAFHSASSLSCYACQFSFNDVYDPENRDGWCANETLLELRIEDTVKPCAPWEKFCVTTTSTSLGSFTSVTRSCAEHCNAFCEAIGYGTDQVTCDDCCDSDRCNNNFSVEYYVSLMQKQYTSWTTPLPGELKFNRANGIRFPY
ncbi:hypothetical protein L596_019478 [Steinernema carpocapsae]|uniref:Snake toxin/toxin-like domain-containing protein n=1 Tax=Steinernema carpocapsae TaxID=34508 RepID=A0A4U5MQN2_STECR|nr:hypothetical protein L596_019478 [Steinernema carpocapsae]